MGKNLYTLSEVVELTGLSRRAIQEYERNEVVDKPAERDKYGHLLYNEKELGRLRIVRLYREYGYSGEEIKGLLANNTMSSEEFLNAQAKKIKREKLKMERLLDVTNFLKELSTDMNAIPSNTIVCDGLTFDEQIESFSAYLSPEVNADKNVKAWQEYISAGADRIDADAFENSFAEICEILYEEKDPKSPIIQSKIQELMESLSNQTGMHGSIPLLLCDLTVEALIVGNESEEDDTEEVLTDETLDLMKDAIRVFWEISGYEKIVTQNGMIWGKIHHAYTLGQKPSNKEVQEKIDMILKTGILGEDVVTQRHHLKGLASILQKESQRKKEAEIEDGEYDAFASKALLYYLKKHPTGKIAKITMSAS